MSCEQETTQPAGDDHVEQDTTKRVAITVAPTIKDLKRDGIQRIAITVAPTADELLPFAVLNVLENLPDEWRVQIFHRYLIKSVDFLSHFTQPRDLFIHQRKRSSAALL